MIACAGPQLHKTYLQPLSTCQDVTFKRLPSAPRSHRHWERLQPISWALQGHRWKRGPSQRVPATTFSNPTSLPLRHELQKAERQAGIPSNKALVAGQLKHCGIRFPPTAKLGPIRAILRCAADEGKVRSYSSTVRCRISLSVPPKCDRVPLVEGRTGEAMEHDAGPLDVEWEVKTDARVHNGRRKSIHSFLVFYVLTDGNPDPLDLYGYRDTHRVYTETDRVPGLSLISGGSGTQQAPCVGWDRFAVCNLIGKTHQEARIASERLAT